VEQGEEIDVFHDEGKEDASCKGGIGRRMKEL